MSDLSTDKPNVRYVPAGTNGASDVLKPSTSDVEAGQLEGGVRYVKFDTEGCECHHPGIFRDFPIFPTKLHYFAPFEGS